MERVRAAGFYFLLVFSAGFALGTLRVLLVVPALGTRTAELLEMPVMLAVVWLAARWVTRRYWRAVTDPAHWLHVGVLALALMLAADVGVGVLLRGMTVREALFARDPVAGTAYYLALCLLAMAPWLISHRLAARSDGRRP